MKIAQINSFVHISMPGYEKKTIPTLFLCISKSIKYRSGKQCGVFFLLFLLGVFGFLVFFFGILFSLSKPSSEGEE